MLLNKNIASSRLIFRSLDECDITQRYIDWLNDPEVNRYLEIRFQNQTFESCREFLTKTNADPNSYLFGIFDPVKKLHIGNIKIGFIREVYSSGQMSLFLGDKSYWGQGYASEAIQKLSHWAFADLKLERLEAGCIDENLRSLRAFIKSGYTVEGYFRKNNIVENKRLGSFWLGLLRDEYHDKKY